MTASSSDSKKFSQRLAEIRNQELKTSEEVKLDDLIKNRAQKSYMYNSLKDT
jgi:hypothetical protein